MSYFNTEKAATKRGQEVLALMTSEGWELNVWENFGWHWSLENGAITLHESVFKGKSRGFWTLMSRRLGGNGGFPEWTARGNDHHKDPNDAVAAQVKLAREVVNQFIESVEHGESLIK